MSDLEGDLESVSRSGVGWLLTSQDQETLFDGWGLVRSPVRSPVRDQ